MDIDSSDHEDILCGRGNGGELGSAGISPVPEGTAQADRPVHDCTVMIQYYMY